MKIIPYALACLFLMSSCEIITETIVESSIQDGLNGMSKSSSTSPINGKTQNKEKEQMIKEGKCPVCRGIGKSIDGKYECSACNGTGKYTSKP